MLKFIILSGLILLFSRCRHAMLILNQSPKPPIPKITVGNTRNFRCTCTDGEAFRTIPVEPKDENFGIVNSLFQNSNENKFEPYSSPKQDTPFESIIASLQNAHDKPKKNGIMSYILEILNDNLPKVDVVKQKQYLPEPALPNLSEEQMKYFLTLLQIPNETQKLNAIKLFLQSIPQNPEGKNVSDNGLLNLMISNLFNKQNPSPRINPNKNLNTNVNNNNNNNDGEFQMPLVQNLRGNQQTPNVPADISAGRQNQIPYYSRPELQIQTRATPKFNTCGKTKNSPTADSEEVTAQFNPGYKIENNLNGQSPSIKPSVWNSISGLLPPTMKYSFFKYMPAGGQLPANNIPMDLNSGASVTGATSPQATVKVQYKNNGQFAPQGMVSQKIPGAAIMGQTINGGFVYPGMNLQTGFIGAGGLGLDAYTNAAGSLIPGLNIPSFALNGNLNGGQQFNAAANNLAGLSGSYEFKNGFGLPNLIGSSGFGLKLNESPMTMQNVAAGLTNGMKLTTQGMNDNSNVNINDNMNDNIKKTAETPNLLSGLKTALSSTSKPADSTTPSA